VSNIDVDVVDREGHGERGTAYPAPPVIMQFLPSRRPMLNGMAMWMDVWFFKVSEDGMSVNLPQQALSYIKG
jgi:hypothetical protein